MSLAHSSLLFRFDDERGVSPVVGTILVVAVTVILAVAVGTTVLVIFADLAEGEPLTSFQMNQDGTTVVFTHAGGDTLDGEEVYIVSESGVWLGNFAGTNGQACDTTISTVQTGTECQISGAPNGKLSVVWRSGGRSSILFQGTVFGDGSASTPTTPSPTASPTVGGYTLRDTSAYNTEYELMYDIDGTAEYDHIEVTFDNRNNNWGDTTSSASEERGVITFYQGGQKGSTYDVTMKVFNTNGTVTDTISITDTADESSQSSGALTDSDSPSFEGTVIDDLGGSEANYEVSYNVTDRANFASVRVQYENLDKGWTDATYTSSDPRHNIDNYAETGFWGTSNDEYHIRVELLDTDGIVVDERVVTDVADGNDPSGNADLTRASSPTLSSYSIEDQTQNNVKTYTVQYQVSDASGDFSQVETIFWNTDTSWATQTNSSTNTNGDLQYNQWTFREDTYRITIRVFDNDGIVVEEVVITDIADGTNP